MIPVRFGADSREMVGFYHPPAQANAANPAVLICNPFGPDLVRGYRMLRVFADRLAAAGCPVLRFDYFGTGDSPGDDEAASLIGWAGDVGSAHRELMARSAKGSVVWIGVRLGASLCALAAQTPRPQLKHIVMWDPVIVGSSYLESFANAAHGRGADDAAVIEILGFALPDRFKNELRGLNLSAVQPPAGTRLSIIVGSQDAETQAWQTALDMNLLVDWTVSRAAAEWNSDKAMNTAVIPVELLQQIQTKLLEVAR